MSSSIIDRDEQQQKSFGEALVSFSTDMKACCQSLRSHIEDAQDTVQADNASGALQYLLDMIKSIEDELPGTDDFGERQKVLAKRIGEASDFKFSKH